jgi:hypothetical protein
MQLLLIITLFFFFFFYNYVLIVLHILTQKMMKMENQKRGDREDLITAVKVGRTGGILPDIWFHI